MISTEFSDDTPQTTPVTVLSGLLDADRTTLLNNLLANSQGHKTAVIVNGFSEVSVDAALTEQGTYLERGEDRFIEISNGCICCTLRDDLVENVNRLVCNGKFEHIVIESTGISESMPVTATLGWEFNDDHRLANIVPIDTIVVLADASMFLGDLRQKRVLPSDERTVADLLVGQMEPADLILITKPDLVGDKLASSAEEAIRTMNPHAHTVRVANGEVVTSATLDALLYDEGAMAIFHGYTGELTNPHIPETEEYSISSVVFRGNHPLDRERLIKVLRSAKDLIRPKGHCWISDHLEVAHVRSQTGPNLKTTPAIVQVQTDAPPSNEVVLIGAKFNPEAILQVFEDAMLTSEEVRELL